MQKIDDEIVAYISYRVPTFQHKSYFNYKTQKYEMVVSDLLILVYELIYVVAFPGERKTNND